MSFAIGFPALHFFALFIASGFVALSNLARAAKLALTVIAAETLFTAGVSLWTLYLMSQDVSKCPGYVRSCPWSDTGSREAQAIVWTALVLLVLNLIPLVISMAFGCLASRIRQSLRSNRAKTIANG